MCVEYKHTHIDTLSYYTLLYTLKSIYESGCKQNTFYTYIHILTDQFQTQTLQK